MGIEYRFMFGNFIEIPVQKSKVTEKEWMCGTCTELLEEDFVYCPKCGGKGYWCDSEQTVELHLGAVLDMDFVEDNFRYYRANYEGESCFIGSYSDNVTEVLDAEGDCYEFKSLPEPEYDERYVWKGLLDMLDKAGIKYIIRYGVVQVTY